MVRATQMNFRIPIDKKLAFEKVCMLEGKSATAIFLEMVDRKIENMDRRLSEAYEIAGIERGPDGCNHDSLFLYLLKLADSGEMPEEVIKEQIKLNGKMHRDQFGAERASKKKGGSDG